MKIYRKVALISLLLIQPLQACQGWLQSALCHGFGKNIYHHGNHKLCLGKSDELSKSDLTHIFDEHFQKTVMYMDLSDQPNLTDAHLEQIAESSCAKHVISMDLYNCKNVTYDGIKALWESETLGSYRRDDPVYYRYDNTPISIVRLEIAKTEAAQQYGKLQTQEGKKIFPLPIRPNFEINYTCPSGRHIEKSVCGYKAVVVSINGERIKK